MGEERSIEVEELECVEISDEARPWTASLRTRVTTGTISRPRSVTESASHAGLRITRDIHGFKFASSSPEDGRPCWRVKGSLAQRVAGWKEEGQCEREREQEERRLRGTKWSKDSMEVDGV